MFDEQSMVPRICYELEMLPTICKLSEKSLKMQKSILIWRKQRRYLKRYRRYNFTSSSLYRDIVLSVFSVDERWEFQLEHRNLMKRIPFTLLSNSIVEFPILYHLIRRANATNWKLYYLIKNAFSERVLQKV